jgi:YggT family protein
MHPVIYRGLSIVSALLLVYMLLLSLRVLLTWFQGSSYGKAWYHLSRITDPYLRLFRGIKFLHLGGWDLTPIAGFILIIIVQNVIISLLRFRSITLGIILAVAVRAIWQSFIGILFILAVLCIIRIIGLFISRSQAHPGWRFLDLVLRPIATRIERTFKKQMGYAPALSLAVVSILITWLVGGLLVNYVVLFLVKLPV